MDVYEVLGQLYHDYRNLRNEYTKVLDLVARIKRGEVEPDTIDILPGDAWKIAEPQNVQDNGDADILTRRSVASKR